MNRTQNNYSIRIGFSIACGMFLLLTGMSDRAISKEESIRIRDESELKVQLTRRGQDMAALRTTAGLRHNVWALLSAAIFASVVCPSATATEANEELAHTPLKVLVVSSVGAGGYAEGIRQLLAEHSVEATVESSLPTATVRECDLIILAGAPGKQDQRYDVASYTKPVLGYGVYGSACFGTLQLKHGYPYT